MKSRNLYVTPACQAALAETLLDADGWVSTGDLASAAGLPARPVGVWMSRGRQRGWFLQQRAGHEVAEWRPTPRGRTELHNLLEVSDETPSASSAELRAWASSIGQDVPDRGTLPTALIERWNRENPDRPHLVPRGPLQFNHQDPESWRRGGLATQAQRRSDEGRSE